MKLQKSVAVSAAELYNAELCCTRPCLLLALLRALVHNRSQVALPALPVCPYRHRIHLTGHEEEVSFYEQLLLEADVYEGYAEKTSTIC